MKTLKNLPAESHSLRIGERAIVQFPGFRCMAIYGADGKWRDEKGKELPEAIAVDYCFGPATSELQSKRHAV